MIDLIIRLFYETQRYLPATEIVVNHFTFDCLQREQMSNIVAPLESIHGIPVKIEGGIEQEIKITIK